MSWIPGWPVDARPYLGQPFTPSALVLHRTIGRWGGDYSVLSRGRVPSVHFLVGEDTGQKVQFYPTSRTCAHAAGANGYSIGIELSGQNGAPLTQWQLDCLREVLDYCHGSLGISKDYLNPEASRVEHWRGVLNHCNVKAPPGYAHADYVNEADYYKAALTVPKSDSRTMKGMEMYWVYTKHERKVYVVSSTNIAEIGYDEGVSLRLSGMPGFEIQNGIGLIVLARRMGVPINGVPV